MHDPSLAGSSGAVRERAEVEAESVAHVVCDRLGADSAEYSIPYVAKWAAGDPERMQVTAQSVLATRPNTANLHLFINVRSAHHTRAVNKAWHTNLLGMPAQQIRQDRIVDEAFATGGDLRQISDLFGLSVAQANTYATHARHARLSDHAGDSDD